MPCARKIINFRKIKTRLVIFFRLKIYNEIPLPSPKIADVLGLFYPCYVDQEL